MRFLAAKLYALIIWLENRKVDELNNLPGSLQKWLWTWKEFGDFNCDFCFLHCFFFSSHMKMVTFIILEESADSQNNVIAQKWFKGRVFKVVVKKIIWKPMHFLFIKLNSWEQKSLPWNFKNLLLINSYLLSHIESSLCS